MKIRENFKQSILLTNNPSFVNDTTYKCLVENAFSVLGGKEEIHNMNNLCKSKPDVIKEVYAAFLYLGAEFVRNGQSKDDASKFLIKDFNFSQNRAETFADIYERKRQKVEVSLLNIGSHLPHITDVKWKIDYIVQSSAIDQSEGPLFRISLSTEQYDNGSRQNKTKVIQFSCNSQELQDLVYKLKDAARHCQRLASDQ